MKTKRMRTFTNLNFARPAWLAAAHQRLDAEVCAAYACPADLGDEEMLARLLALNLERAQQQNTDWENGRMEEALFTV